MPKRGRKTKSSSSSPQKCGKGKAWRRGENKRLLRSNMNKYVQILENGESFFFRREISFFHHTSSISGERGKNAYNGKSITESRSHVDVALAVAKKVWAQNKRLQSIEVMHLDSGKRFRFNPESWQANGQRKFDSGKKSKRKQNYGISDHFEEECSSSSSYFSGFPRTDLRIHTPPPIRHRKRTNSDLEDSPRLLKSPRLSSSTGSTGLTPRLEAATIDREVSPLERPRRKIRQPKIGNLS